VPGYRKALLIGVDDYPDAPLESCVADALAMAEILKHHENGDPNFSTQTLTSNKDEITRARTREALADLFASDSDFDLLFYFAGHGAVSALGPELVTVDYTAPSSWGVSLYDVAQLANSSSSHSVTIVLDCCFSGGIGHQYTTMGLERFGRVELRQGVTFFAASRPSETAAESDGHGAFTRMLLHGLRGAAADLHGDVTAVGLHMLADTAFTSGWAQHPVLKIHSQGAPVLRSCTPKVDRLTLRKLTEVFPEPHSFVRVPHDQILPGSQPAASGHLDATLVAAVLSYAKAGLVAYRPGDTRNAEVFLTLQGEHVHELVRLEAI
jgi:hypothetical protein